MSKHACVRCGLESSCSHGSWADRHPVVAVVAGLFGLVWMSMMLSVHPVTSGVMAVLGVGVVGVRAVAAARVRRAALVARADYEHRTLLAAAPAPLKWPPEPLLSPSLPRGAVRSRRPADHWSTTEPMQATR